MWGEKCLDNLQWSRHLQPGNRHVGEEALLDIPSSQVFDDQSQLRFYCNPMKDPKWELSCWDPSTLRTNGGNNKFVLSHKFGDDLLHSSRNKALIFISEGTLEGASSTCWCLDGTWQSLRDGQVIFWLILWATQAYPGMEIKVCRWDWSSVGSLLWLHKLLRYGNIFIPVGK